MKPCCCSDHTRGMSFASLNPVIKKMLCFAVIMIPIVEISPSRQPTAVLQLQPDRKHHLARSWDSLSTTTGSRNIFQC